MASSVIVGMSGGVDSAVAALLLQERGLAVEGMFMKNWEEDDGAEYCTAQADFDDARRVCDRLNIPLREANFAAEYWDNVFEHFLSEYAAGRTPNPDVLCNSEIKFNVFLDYARLLGADRIATGHYARSDRVDGEFALLKGVDRNKDQSYFLQAVPRDRLRGCLFPLGGLKKPTVRKIARSAGLHVHDKKDSTGICFIGERRFADFLARYLPRRAGPMIDTEGKVVGEHPGLPYFTLGQRQGLGIGGRAGYPEMPWYVVDKRPDENTLVVTQDESRLLSRSLVAREVNWLASVELPLRCMAKTRYRQPDRPCRVEAREDGANSGTNSIAVTFDAPQRAVTPGQYVCLYAGERCLGGGTITATDAPEALAA